MNTYFQFFQHPVFDAIGGALLHALWQGAAVAGILFIVLRVIRKDRSELRYALCCAALIVMALLPVATAVQLYVSSSTEAILRGPGNAVEARHAATQRALNTDTVGPVAIEKTIETITHAWSARAFPWRFLVVPLWMAGLAIMALRWLGGIVAGRRLQQSGVPVYHEQIEAAFEALKNQLRIKSNVQLKASWYSKQPALIGWFKPVVLLPVSVLTALPPEQVEAILAHELAHIRRHDYLALMLQTAVETLYFYQPAVWWVSKRMHIEREYCCDRMAAEAVGNDFVYASALASLAQPEKSLAFALGARDGRPVDRIRRIVDRGVQTHSLRRRPFSGWESGVLLIGCMVLLAACLQRVREPGGDPLETLYDGAVEALEKRDFVKAKILAEQAADAGHVCSCRLLVDIYDTRKGNVSERDGTIYSRITWGGQSDSMSVYWAHRFKQSLEDKALAGDDLAMLWMHFGYRGLGYDKLFVGFSKSDSLANVWLDRALETNNPYAWRLEAVKTIKQGNYEEADRLFEKAYKLGDEAAFWWWAHSDTVQVLQPDPHRFFSIANKAIEHNAPGTRIWLQRTVTTLREQAGLGNEYAVEWLVIADSLRIAERIQSLPETRDPVPYPEFSNLCPYERDWFYEPA